MIFLVPLAPGCSNSHGPTDGRTPGPSLVPQGLSNTLPDCINVPTEEETRAEEDEEEQEEVRIFEPKGPLKFFFFYCFISSSHI